MKSLTINTIQSTIKQDQIIIQFFVLLSNDYTGFSGSVLEDVNQMVFIEL